MTFKASGQQSPAKRARLQNSPSKDSNVTCLVTQDVPAIELIPSAKPRLVMISANSVVELKGTSGPGDFVGLIWDRKTYLTFAADLIRLNADRNGGK